MRQRYALAALLAVLFLMLYAEHSAWQTCDQTKHLLSLSVERLSA